jgi:hypothetical protein
MAETKKLLVPFDPTKPRWNPNEFLVPCHADIGIGFRGLKNGQAYEFGRMVYIGKPITENDLFAKLVDSGAVISSVDDTLCLLRSYVEGLQSLKIGNVARIRSAKHGNHCEVEFELVANTPSAAKA